MNNAQTPGAIDPLTRLTELGLSAPQAPGAVAAYEPWQRMGNIVTTSFQLPWVDGKLRYVGRLGEALSVDEGVSAAQVCALMASRNCYKRQKPRQGADRSHREPCRLR